MSDLDLEAIRARCEAATPGPWDVRTVDLLQTYDTWWANRLFTAHARTDLPAALDEIDRLRAESGPYLLQIVTDGITIANLKAERDRLQELADAGQTAYEAMQAANDDLREALRVAADDLQFERDRVSALEAGRRE